MVGTVKSSLAQSMKTAVEAVDSNLKVTIADGTGSADYSIFVLANSQFWALKSTTKEMLDGGISVYCMNIMW